MATDVTLKACCVLLNYVFRIMIRKFVYLMHLIF